jgi:hypothetical protein
MTITITLEPYQLDWLIAELDAIWDNAYSHIRSSDPDRLTCEEIRQLLHEKAK